MHAKASLWKEPPATKRCEQLPCNTLPDILQRLAMPESDSTKAFGV
jgi:hypothetical protein